MMTVTSMQITVRLAVQRCANECEGWQTVELTAEIQIEDEHWQEHARQMLKHLDEEARRYLAQTASVALTSAADDASDDQGNPASTSAADSASDGHRTVSTSTRRPRQRVNGRRNGNGKKDFVTLFWEAVYSAGMSQDDGLAVLERAKGDFARAFAMLEEGNGEG